MSFVTFRDGRPAEILPVSATVLRELYHYLEEYPSITPLRLPYASVYPKSNDLMARRLGLNVLSNELLHCLRTVIKDHPTTFSVDPRGTLLYLELFTELTTILNNSRTYSGVPALLQRAIQISQTVAATTQVLEDAFSQRMSDGITSPFAPNCKKLSASFLPAPTCNGILISVNAAVAVNKEMLRRCPCCGFALTCATSGELRVGECQ